MKIRNPTKELLELEHKLHIEEIDFRAKREIEILRLSHELELERNRIKSAEIRKSQMRKFASPYLK